MSTIRTTKATERLSRKLQRAGLALWVGESSGDAWGKYLLFRVGGKCVGGAGWSLRECSEHVAHRVRHAGADEVPPFHFAG